MKSVDLAKENNEFGKKGEMILNRRHTRMFNLALFALNAALEVPSLHTVPASAPALPTVCHDRLVISLILVFVPV